MLVRAFVAALGVAVVAACGTAPTDSCKKTCDGCCRGETCLSGSSALACGINGSVCNNCDSLRLSCIAATGLCGASGAGGGSAGTGGGSGLDPHEMVSVTLKWDAAVSGCASSGTCPQCPAVTCSRAKLMERQRFESLGSAYVACVTSDSRSTNPIIDCTRRHMCRETTVGCGGLTSTTTECDYPPGAGPQMPLAGGCDWSPP